MRAVSEDAATALLRAIGASFAGFAGSFRIESLVSRSWASVTFRGARHHVAFSLAGAGADAAANAFIRGLPSADFDLAGHIVADIVLLSAERAPAEDRVAVTLEALTVEDS